jgi:6-phosphogluconolactonase
VALFPVREDGSLAEASNIHQHEGSGPNEARQEGPHAHCIVVSPDDRFAFSCDLGADRIFGYRIDHAAKELVRHNELAMPAGSGPRHFAFSPDGRHAYAICELDPTMAAFDYDPASGTLTHLESHAMLPPDVEGHSHCADIAVHPSGRFVYGSNRGHDSITMFAADPTTGRLTPLGHRSTEGRTPRNFTIAPDGRFLLVANQDSDTIVTIAIDERTGRLEETVAVTPMPTPVCVRFGR